MGRRPEHPYPYAAITAGPVATNMRIICRAMTTRATLIGGLAVVGWLAATLAACDHDDHGGFLDPPARLVVRTRIVALARAATLGHRGTGVNRLGHPLPENSVASFAAAMADGADGIELDAELTADGALVVMHDDTLDRTTTCRGCVSAYTFAAIRQCRLIDGDGRVSREAPPTLDEAYAVVPRDALVNVELKVFSEPCRTPPTGADALVRATVDAVARLGARRRTLFSSFDEAAVVALKEADPDLYVALLVDELRPDTVERAVARKLDAVHPLQLVGAAGVRSILDAGLQANLWTVNAAEDVAASLNKGATAIITDEPAKVKAVLVERSAYR